MFSDVLQQGKFFHAEPVTETNVVFEGEGPEENYGTEDPRVVYREKTGEYILLYTAVREFSNGTLSAKLSMATTRTPSVKSSWVRHGPVFPDIAWSKSGALLLRDDVPNSPHYLIFGDSSLLPGIQMATSYDLKTWTIQTGLFLEIRPNSWDSALVESGPMPLRLSDGNYLFLYNSARGGFPSKKPGYQFQYNLGWLVLDQNDPTKILARSEEPILSPVLDWEAGTNPNGLALVPNVVFCEGWVRSGPVQGNGFTIYYGGADSVTGAANLQVHIKSN
jgi:predicted GH43/DUF377 family glycosyl hydrolase